MLCSIRCWGWLAISCFVRLLCGLLNAHAFRGWACPVKPRFPTGYKTTGLEVIVPSLPTTGSTSMQVALETLGLRAYKGDELMFYLPEVFDRDLPAQKLVEPFRACGVKAFVGDDSFGLVANLLKVSPSAKVVLTSRGSWREWREAFLRARSGPEERLFELLNLLLCNWLPVGAFWFDEDVGHSFVKGSLTTMLLQNCLLETRKSRLPPGAEGLMIPHDSLLYNESFYNEWMDMLRSLVPPERFMEFDFRRHGWQDLARFLGRPVPTGNLKFPRTMGGTTSNDILKLQLFPGRFLAFWALMLLSAVVHCMALRQLARIPRLGADRAGHGESSHKRD